MCNCSITRSLFQLVLTSFTRPNRCIRLQYSFKSRYISSLSILCRGDNYGTYKDYSLRSSSLYDVTIRNYAKGRDKPRSSKGKIVGVLDEEIAEFTNVKKLREEMSNEIAVLKDEFIKQVSLRSSSGAIESLPVTFEGQEYTIQDLAQISRKSSKLIVLNLALFPQTIQAVIDAINKSGMNLNPQQDSTSVYIEIPKVTKEHREGLAKNANALFVKCKTKINAIMSLYIKKLDSKLNSGMSIEQYKLVQNQIMDIAKSYIAEAEKMKNDKQAEVLREN